MNLLEQVLPYSAYEINSITRFGEYRMKTIGNIIWFLFGGVFMGLAWCARIPYHRWYSMG